jgi:hypothetical protein
MENAELEAKINRVESNQGLVNQYRDKVANLDPRQKKDLMASIAWLFLTDNIKKNKREKIQRDLKRNDTITLVLALLGIVTNIISSSMYIQFQTIKGKKILLP